MWQAETKINKRMPCFVLQGKKKTKKTINSFIKIGISGYTMIHHVNKVTEAGFQTEAGFNHGRI